MLPAASASVLSAVVKALHSGIITSDEPSALGFSLFLHMVSYQKKSVMPSLGAQDDNTPHRRSDTGRTHIKCIKSGTQDLSTCPRPPDTVPRTKNIPAPFSHGKLDLFLKEHILLKANYDPSAGVAILNLESQVLTVSTIQTKPNYQLSLDLLCLELPDNETTCQCQ